MSVEGRSPPQADLENVMRSQGHEFMQPLHGHMAPSMRIPIRFCKGNPGDTNSYSDIMAMPGYPAMAC